VTGDFGGPERAKAEMGTITAAQMKAYPEDYSASGVSLMSLREQ
jgi:hypothetical protein